MPGHSEFAFGTAIEAGLTGRAAMKNANPVTMTRRWRCSPLT